MVVVVLVLVPVLVLVLVLVLMIISVQAQPSPGEAGFGPGFNGLATRPPMGYVQRDDCIMLLLCALLCAAVLRT